MTVVTGSLRAAGLNETCSRVAGNVLLLVTAHGARYRSGSRRLHVYLSVCLSAWHYIVDTNFDDLA